MMSERDERFHAYPLKDQIGAHRLRRRLDGLELDATERIAAFVARRCTMLALSFGKDSMVCLHLAQAAGVLDQLPVVMYNGSGMDTPDTVAMRRYVVARYGLRNFVKTQPDQETLERTLRSVDIGARHPTRDFVYECLERPRWRVMDEHEIDGVILGMRAAESRNRAIVVATKGPEYWSRREKAETLLPLANWRTEDVFCYAMSRDVPLHPVYKRMPEMGFDRDRVRLSSPVNLVGAGYGQIEALRRLYPDTYRRYIALVPEVSTLT